MTLGTDWFRQTGRTYFGNAAAQRDYRVQLRGNRSMLLFGTYLALLIGVGYFKYSSIAGNAEVSVVQAQRELRDFYTLIVYLLAGVVSVVTPALAATAIVSERQRRSLDLVFSAPVAPRYYLVGKTIAVYRYIWMMLILSLPVTAACVVLGGASWSDVLTVYGLLSIHGLLFAAIGLMISTVAPRPVSAIVWTYAAVVGYLMLTASTGAIGMTRVFMGRGGTSTEAPFTIGLNPFFALYAVGTTTSVFGVAVPNFIVASLAILVAVRLCLLGAGSVLSEGRETPNLRLHWLVVTAVAAYALGHWLASSFMASALSSTTVPGVDTRSLVLGIPLFWLLSPLLLVLPSLATYGNDGFLRQRANGAFVPRRMLDGTPAGALPYLALLILLAISGVLAGAIAGGGAPGWPFFAYALYALAFWTFFWAVGRAASSFGGGLRASRTVVITTMIVLLVLPLPFMSALTAGDTERVKNPIYDLSPLSPVTGIGTPGLALTLTYGVGLLVGAYAVYAYSERRRTTPRGAVA